jgi:hypothetical protein
MEILQKKFSNKTKFEFQDESLKFIVKDNSGSQTFSVDYGLIPTDYWEIEERNLWYRNVGGIWTALGILFIVLEYMKTGEIRNAIWLLIGLCCLTIYWIAKTEYTVIDTENGRLYIIKDNQHDEILKEIDTRRKAQWLSLYGLVNLENDAASEIDKFKWLFDRDVISKEEYQEKEKIISNHYDFDISSTTPKRKIGII